MEEGREEQVRCVLQADRGSASPAVPQLTLHRISFCSMAGASSSGQHPDLLGRDCQGYSGL